MPDWLNGILLSMGDALLDTVKLLPAVLLMYVIIEILEDLSLFKKANPLLASRLAPLFGAGVALFPQCGFSVVASRLYSERKIKMGTLLAVFMATSDEAVPVMLANPDSFSKLVLLLSIKFVAAVIFGVIINALIKTQLVKPAPVVTSETALQTNSAVNVETALQTAQATKSETALQNGLQTSPVVTSETAVQTSLHAEPCDLGEKVLSHEGCGCHKCEEKDKGTKHYLKSYMLNPLLHTLKIGAFILAVNIALGLIIHFVSEERLEAFLKASLYIQPIVCLIVGLIPNCASSVVLASLLSSGALSFGAALCGLTAAAGVGIIVLIKMNRPVRDTMLVLGILCLISLILGYATLWINI